MAKRARLCIACGMGALINFLVLLVFLFVGLAQHGDLSKQVGYGVGIPLAVVALVLAAVRYKQRKDAGE